MGYILITKIMINYKLHMNGQHTNLYMLIIYIIRMKCVNVIMNHHLQLNVKCNFINFVATLTLGLWPKQRLRECRPREMWESVRMKIHTPKWAPILGVGISVDSGIFIEQWQRSKHLSLRSSLYQWKAIEV